MRRRALINLVLFGMAALLGLGVHLDLTRSAAPRLPPLTALQPAVIGEIRIHDGKDKDILLVKQDGQWQMRRPYPVAAAEERVQQLLAIATTPVQRRIPAGEEDLGRYGLSPSGLRLELDGIGIDFGTTEPLRFRRYVRAGGQVSLIDDGFYHHLIASAEDFVSRRLLPPGARADVARSRARPLELNQLLTLTADGVTRLGEPPEGIELSIWLWDAPEAIPLLLSSDRRQLARPGLGLVYQFQTPIPLRQPPHPSP
jgi:hypothetical protein